MLFYNRQAGKYFQIQNNPQYASGIAANGDIIVSSWGGQWTVSASECNDYNDLYFTTLIYSEAETDGEG